jgi:hypothetical protein
MTDKQTELERLARVEERMKNVDARLDFWTADRKEKQAEIKEILSQFWEALKWHETKDQERFEKTLSYLEANYVRKNEFTPVKNLAYAFVGVSLTAIVWSLFKLIII